MEHAVNKLKTHARMHTHTHQKVTDYQELDSSSRSFVTEYIYLIPNTAAQVQWKSGCPCP